MNYSGPLIISALEEAGMEVSLMPPDNIKIRPVSLMAPPEIIVSLVKKARRRKPEILKALRQREFARLHALVQASVAGAAEVYPEGGIEEAKRLGMWPRLLALEHAIDQALKNLDEPALLGALEAWEKAWGELRDAMARQRHTRAPAPVEATA